jgi:hypothetical protein
MANQELNLLFMSHGSNVVRPTKIREENSILTACRLGLYEIPRSLKVESAKAKIFQRNEKSKRISILYPSIFQAIGLIRIGGARSTD